MAGFPFHPVWLQSQQAVRAFIERVLSVCSSLEHALYIKHHLGEITLVGIECGCRLRQPWNRVADSKCQGQQSEQQKPSQMKRKSQPTPQQVWHML